MNPLRALFKKTILLSTIPLLAGVAKGEGLDENFKMLDQWVTVKKTISKERFDWEVDRQGFVDLLKVYREELQMLTEKIDDAEAFSSAVDEKKAGLLEEQEAIRSIEAKLEAVVNSQEQHLKQLIRRMPSPLQQEILPLTRRIPEDPSKTSLSISQRLQSIVGILTQVDKFNTAVEVAPEQREFDGNLIQVSAIYFGLGAAYYADRAGEHAGYGRVTDAGWEWVADNAIAADVLSLIEMYEGNTTKIRFVPVPVNINR